MLSKGVWPRIRLIGMRGRLSHAMMGQFPGSSVSSRSYISSPTKECMANAPYPVARMYMPLEDYVSWSKEHCVGDIPAPNENTTAPAAMTATILPPICKAPLKLSIIRNTSGLSESHSYSVPHCGHLMAVPCFDGLSSDDRIHSRRQLSCARRVHLHGCTHRLGYGVGSVDVEPVTHVIEFPQLG